MLQPQTQSLPVSISHNLRRTIINARRGEANELRCTCCSQADHVRERECVCLCVCECMANTFATSANDALCVLHVLRLQKRLKRLTRSSICAQNTMRDGGQAEREERKGRGGERTGHKNKKAKTKVVRRCPGGVCEYVCAMLCRNRQFVA